MSGHSHAKTVKRKKDAAAAVRSKAFGKLSNELAVAAREGGGDPETNPGLRMVIEKARKLNMPSENIARAIRRGTGEESGAALEELLLEGYGPGGVALLIKGITDNKNRALSEIKQILERHGGKLVGEGAVRWMFERRGTLFVVPEGMGKEQVELAAIDAGAEDLHWYEDGGLDVYAPLSRLGETKEGLEKAEIPVDSASIDWVPQERVEMPEHARQRLEALIEALDEHDAVQDVYSNLS